MNIRFYNTKPGLLPGNIKIIKNWIEKVIRTEGKSPGDLSFIFTDEKEMLNLNKEFLGHNYQTDVITFNYNDGDIINGEVYLGTETILSNALVFEVSNKDEIYRVIIHGVLHLLGYEDKSNEEKLIMREKEDSYLALMNN